MTTKRIRLGYTTIDRGGIHFIPTRSKSKYDEIIEVVNKSPDEKLTELTSLLVTKKLTVITPN